MFHMVSRHQSILLAPLHLDVFEQRGRRPENGAPAGEEGVRREQAGGYCRSLTLQKEWDHGGFLVGSDVGGR